MEEASWQSPQSLRDIRSTRRAYGVLEGIAEDNGSGAMKRRSFIFAGMALPILAAQETPVEFLCPMDLNVRSPKPGRCPRCGMTLVPGIPDFLEYPVSVRLRPNVPRAGQRVQMSFAVSHPKTGSRVKDFQEIHEKLYHLFIVSQDLEFFQHDHPQLQRDGVFHFDAVFPKPGMYRLLSDFYPQHGTPQLVANTVIIPGGPITPGTLLEQDLKAKRSANMEISLTVEPAQPIAGMKTMLFFRLDPTVGLERYLGAWGHMLAASEDLT